MYAIRQFMESLGLGLGVGLFLVVCALFVLDAADDAGPGSEPGALSSPATQPDLRRDENGVPIRPRTRARDDERVG